MKTKEQIIVNVKKLHALATRGVGGEKKTAAKMLRALCKKHDIDPDALIRREIELRICIFKVKDDPERVIIAQILFHFTGYGDNEHDRGDLKYREFKTRSKNKFELYVKLTRIEEIEVSEAWDFYRAKFEEEKKVLTSAFIHKHHLFSRQEEKRPEEVEEKTEEEEKEDLKKKMKLANMINGIDDQKFENTKKLEN